MTGPSGFLVSFLWGILLKHKRRLTANVYLGNVNYIQSFCTCYFQPRSQVWSPEPTVTLKSLGRETIVMAAMAAVTCRLFISCESWSILPLEVALVSIRVNLSNVYNRLRNLLAPMAVLHAIWQDINKEFEVCCGVGGKHQHMYSVFFIDHTAYDREWRMRKGK